MRLRERASLLVMVAIGTPVYLLAELLVRLLQLIGWHRWLPVLQRAAGIRRRVLYLEVFFPEASGYVYRVTNWASVLQANGFTTRVRYALGKRASDALLGKGLTGAFLAAYLLPRLFQCLSAPLYNCVIVRRELLLFNDYGNLFMERLLLALNPCVVLDFDDDISASKGEPRAISPVGRALRENPTKFGECLRLYPRFIAGSRYLQELVIERRSNLQPAQIEVIPTCVSYRNEPAKEYDTRESMITFGWIGTNGNLPKLERIVPDLEALSRQTPLRLIVIAGRDLEVVPDFPVENRRWSLSTQIRDLLEVDVGLMPLADSLVERGKCGFKLIQYMGLGIVSVASAITTNCEIVSDGIDGFLVPPDGSWLDALQRAVARRDDFVQIGRAARAKIERAYSVDAFSERYVEFISACAGEARPSRISGRAGA